MKKRKEIPTQGYQHCGRFSMPRPIRGEVLSIRAHISSLCARGFGVRVEKAEGGRR